MTTPLKLRKLRATMALKDLSVRDVADLSGVPYSTTSQILGGHMNDRARLALIRKAINGAAMPQEARG